MRPSKRDELVRGALAVFYEHGFHATGMDLLAQKTGISKTSMYKHFKSKEDLILATLKLRDEEFRNRLTRRMEKLAADPGKRLLALFDALDEWFHDKNFRSCMFLKASAEYQDPDSPIRKFSAEHKLILEDYLRGLAEQAGLENPEELARQIHMLAEGAIVTAHLHGPAGVAASAKRAAQAVVNNAPGAR